MVVPYWAATRCSTRLWRRRRTLCELEVVYPRWGEGAPGGLRRSARSSACSRMAGVSGAEAPPLRRCRCRQLRLGHRADLRGSAALRHRGRPRSKSPGSGTRGTSVFDGLGVRSTTAVALRGERARRSSLAPLPTVRGDRCGGWGRAIRSLCSRSWMDGWDSSAATIPLSAPRSSDARRYSIKQLLRSLPSASVGLELPGAAALEDSAPGSRPDVAGWTVRPTGTSSARPARLRRLRAPRVWPTVLRRISRGAAPGGWSPTGSRTRQRDADRGGPRARRLGHGGARPSRTRPLDGRGRHRGRRRSTPRRRATRGTRCRWTSSGSPGTSATSPPSSPCFERRIAPERGHGEGLRRRDDLRGNRRDRWEVLLA